MRVRLHFNHILLCSIATRASFSCVGRGAIAVATKPNREKNAKFLLCSFWTIRTRKKGSIRSRDKTKKSAAAKDEKKKRRKKRCSFVNYSVDYTYNVRTHTSLCKTEVPITRRYPISVPLCTLHLDRPPHTRLYPHPPATYKKKSTKHERRDSACDANYKLLDLQRIIFLAPTSNGMSLSLFSLAFRLSYLEKSSWEACFLRPLSRTL